MGKPSFIAKAYGLSLHQILERYLEMWNLSKFLVCIRTTFSGTLLFTLTFFCRVVLERTNNVIPETREKFADPIDALEYLLSAYNRAASEVGDVRTFCG